MIPDGRLPIDALFFDFDGTLGDTESEIRGSWLKAIESLQLDCPDFDRIFRVGPSIQETSKMLFPDSTEEFRETLRKAYRHFYDDSNLDGTSPYPWAEKMLQDFKSRGKELYIVTNKRFVPTMKLLKNFGFRKYFSGIFVPDIVPQHTLSKNALMELGVRVSAIPAERCMMIGDTELDICAGKFAGAHTCAVTWGYGDTAKLLASAPEIVVENSDLISAFDKKFK